LWKI